jgi:hypothetical protein
MAALARVVVVAVVILNSTPGNLGPRHGLMNVPKSNGCGSGWRTRWKWVLLLW